VQPEVASDDQVSRGDDSTHHSKGCFKHLFKELGEPAVKFELVDAEPVIIDANTEFENTFNYPGESPIGEKLNDLIVPPGEKEKAKQFDDRTKDGKSNAAVVERLTTTGKKRFIYRGVPYRSKYGFAIYTDVTEKLNRERHLNVLHRVMRHNLRNNISVIIGHASNIIDGPGEDEDITRESAKQIKKKGQEIVQLIEEAKTIQDVLQTETMLSPTRLQSIVDDVTEDCKATFSTCSIEQDGSLDYVVKGNNKLQIAIRSIVDNAIRHNDSSLPRVTISAERIDSSMIELTVSDNGPGIPEMEQDVITNGGEITALHHGSGLGLWLVKWIIESHGGKLLIETPPSGGTTVRVQLQSHDTQG